MPFLRAFILHLLMSRSRRENLRQLCEMLILVLALVVLFASLFHHLMQAEGREFSTVAGLYWTFTVMTTLGFGDITFAEDAGRAFSVVVMVTGVLFQAVLLPFTVINFLWEPMMAARRQARTPREAPRRLRGHVLLTRFRDEDGPFVRKLTARGIPYRILEPDLDQASRLHDRGLEVVVGDLDDPDTYRRAGIDRAALVVANHGEAANAMIATTAREAHDATPVAATADSAAAAEVLRAAGSDRVIEPAAVVGQAMARRVLLASGGSQIVGRLGGVAVAEVSVAANHLAGRRLADLHLPRHGLQAIGVWERGVLGEPDPARILDGDDVLVLVGEETALAAWSAAAAPAAPAGARPVIVVGGGRVGRAAAAALAGRGFMPVVVEKAPGDRVPPGRRVVGDATDAAVLADAGIAEASAALVTTHQDDLNLFLTVRLRVRRPELRLVARASAERNVSSLYRAGADAVVSYPSILGNLLFNMLRRGRVLLVAEGLAMALVPVPRRLAGRCLGEAGIRATTGCTVAAFDGADGRSLMPGPAAVLPDGGRLLLAGTMAAVDRWFSRHGAPAEILEGTEELATSVQQPSAQ